MSIESTQDRTWGHKGSSSCKCKKIKSETGALKHQNAKLDNKKNDKDDQNLQSVDFKVEEVHTTAKSATLV